MEKRGRQCVEVYALEGSEIVLLCEVATHELEYHRKARGGVTHRLAHQRSPLQP